MDLAIVGDVEVIQQDDALGRLLLLHLGKEVPLHILHDLPPDLVGRHGHEGQMKRQLDIVVARLLVPVDRIELLSFCVQGERHTRHRPGLDGKVAGFGQKATGRVQRQADGRGKAHDLLLNAVLLLVQREEEGSPYKKKKKEEAPGQCMARHPAKAHRCRDPRACRPNR